MKKEGKHIDEVFREGLMDINVTPPSDVWNTIEKNISHRKSFLLPFYRLAAASILLMMIIGSFWLIFLRKPMDRDVADQPTLSGPSIKNVTPAAKDKVAQEPVTPPAEKNTTGSKAHTVESPVVQTSKTFEYTGDAVAEAGDIPGTIPGNHAVERAVAAPYSPDLSGATAVHYLSPEAPLLFADLDLSMREKEQPVWFMVSQPENITEDRAEGENHWRLEGNFGPFYSYRILDTQNKLYGSYLNDQENGIFAYAGGLVVNYKKGKSRLSVQTGISLAKMGLVADDVIAFRNIKTGNYALLETKGNEFIHLSQGRLSYDENPLFVANEISPVGMDQTDYLLTRVGSNLYEKVDVSLKQNLSFVEIPVIIKYQVVDADVGVSVLGGFGSSILINGKSVVLAGKDAITIGNTSDLHRANLNGIVGVGMSYNISKNFRFQIEPTFKYYLNALNKYSDVRAHPYSLGFYSGLSLAF